MRPRWRLRPETQWSAAQMLGDLKHRPSTSTARSSRSLTSGPGPGLQQVRTLVPSPHLRKVWAARDKPARARGDAPALHEQHNLLAKVCKFAGEHALASPPILNEEADQFHIERSALFTYFRTYVLTYLLTYLRTHLLTYLLSFLLILTYLRAYVHTYLRTYVLTCVLRSVSK